MAAYESPTTYGPEKPAGVPVFWFRTSTCFRFTKRCSNNFLLSSDQSISSLHVLEKQLLSILMNRCTSNYIISGVKLLSSPALCIWSGAFNFRAWFRKWNMAVKIPILRPASEVSASCFNYVGPCRWFYLALDGFSSF